MTHDADESTPLLRQISPSPTSYQASLSSEPQDELGRSLKIPHVSRFLREHVIAILYLYLLIVEFGNYLQAAPRAAVYENIICDFGSVKNGGRDVPRGYGSDCKGSKVQDELAFVRGMQEMFDCLPGLFLAMPYGHLANRYGRKLILFTALVGMCLQYSWVFMVTWFSSTFPLRLVWLSSLFLVIGGGQPVSRSLAFVIVSDVTSEKQRATVFFRIEAVALIARAAASALSSFIMARDLWLPMILGLGFIYLGSLFALLLPTTGKGEGCPEQVQSREDGVGVETNETSSLLQSSRSKPTDRMWKTIWMAMSQDRRIILLLAVAICGQLASRTTGLLLQYAAKRYMWTFARANMLLVLRMVVTVVALLVLIPLLTPLLKRLPSVLRPASKDMFLARFSTLLLAIGLAFMTFASKSGLMIAGITIWSCGFGAFSALRSVMTAIALQAGRNIDSNPAPSGYRQAVNDHRENSAGRDGRDHISILYAAVSLGQTVAKSIAGPIYAGLFQKGQRLGGMGQGLPFGFATVLALLVHCALWMVNVGAS